MYASSASSLTELVSALEAAGYRQQMIVTDGGQVTCRSCGTTQRPARYQLHEQLRTEGASDPGDMALVVALVCPSCSAQGTLVLKFGPEASPDEAECMRQLDGID
jgi:Zn ribbon nucleic-acid-binding protein